MPLAPWSDVFPVLYTRWVKSYAHFHGNEPRNPLNMIIQENHAATRANSIVTYLSPAHNPIEEI